MERNKGNVGRPTTGQALTPAERKQAQRERDNIDLTEKPPREWSERLCLLALASPNHKALAHKAWLRLGELHNFPEVRRQVIRTAAKQKGKQHVKRTK